MTRFVFYRQRRRDGGLRTGIELDGDTCFESFEPGAEDSDPSLAWYIDLRGTGDSLPRDPDGLRSWLLAHEETIRTALSDFASLLRTGLDPSHRPAEFKFPDVLDGVTAELVLFVSDREEARHVSEAIESLSGGFGEILRRLDAVQPAP